MDTYPINILSLCAGIGGIDLGLSLAIEGARTVCLVENEVTAIEKLVARMEDGTLDQAPVWTNLKTFDGKPWRGRVDILTAGYPCQPFSCAGKQRGAKDPRHLWPHVARIIGEVQPEIVFLENVEHHLRIGYREVRRDLRSLTYAVEEGLFSAAEVGAPHLRKRLFILAHSMRIKWRFLDHFETRISEAERRAEYKKKDIGHCGFSQPRGLRSLLFPPGPEARGKLAIKPSICGSADGLSAELDGRLHAIGNGVVPLVAAFAFRSLARTAVEKLTGFTKVRGCAPPEATAA